MKATAMRLPNRSNSLIGTHVRVGEQVIGYEVGTEDVSILKVPAGTYVLRSSQGNVDSRNGRMPYFVAAKQVRVDGACDR
jgi:hypothetical protein